MRPATDLASFVAGFVVAEGCFTGTGDRRFRFVLSVGHHDTALCHRLPGWLGVGRVHTHPRRKPHYQNEIVYSVGSIPDLVEVIVPFMDEHLPPSHKREQYLDWRSRLLDYWEHRAKRRKPCTVEGCDVPQRAKGLCRRHYYERYGG